MIQTGECPKCEKMVRNAHIESIEIGVKFTGPKYNGISMLCPSCRTVLGVAIDPIALKRDIVDEVLKGLGAKSKMR